MVFNESDNSSVVVGAKTTVLFGLEKEKRNLSLLAFGGEREREVEGGTERETERERARSVFFMSRMKEEKQQVCEALEASGRLDDKGSERPANQTGNQEPGSTSRSRGAWRRPAGSPCHYRVMTRRITL